MELWLITSRERVSEALRDRWRRAMLTEPDGDRISEALDQVGRRDDETEWLSAAAAKLHI